MKKKCAITGASGYVGSRVAAYMRDRDWEVLALTGNKAAQGTAGAVPYSLEGDVSPDTLRGADALIHCAYDFRLVSWEDIHRVNVLGAARLFEAARRAGVRKTVCISTMSAYEGCRSSYGRAKLAIEQEAARSGGAIVRPGLVYGKNAGGMVGALDRVTARARVIPLIGTGGWMMYLAFEEDLCALIHKLCEADSAQIRQPVTAASSRGMTFKEILSELARAHGNTPVFIPVPWRMVWLGLRVLEMLGIKAGFRSDSVVSLAYADPRPSFREAAGLGVTFRDFRPELLR